MRHPSTVMLIVAAGRGVRAGEGLPKQYRHLAGVPVLTHTLRASLASAGDAATIATLRSVHLARYTLLADELDEFIRKRDYRFAREPSGSERDSWVRAIEALSGTPGLHPAAVVDSSPGGTS